MRVRSGVGEVPTLLYYGAQVRTRQAPTHAEDDRPNHLRGAARSKPQALAFVSPAQRSPGVSVPAAAADDNLPESERSPKHRADGQRWR